MSGHKSPAARYRRYAQQCLEMAQVVTANQARTLGSKDQNQGREPYDPEDDQA
jgi:hypothetical protein